MNSGHAARYLDRATQSHQTVAPGTGIVPSTIRLIRCISGIRVLPLNLDASPARLVRRWRSPKKGLVSARRTDLAVHLGLEGPRGILRANAGLTQVLDGHR